MTLTEIAKLNKSDKEHAHMYFSLFYENELTKYQNQNISLLEIGIYFGDSLRIWKDFFKNCNIVGVDIQNIVKEENKEILNSENIQIFFTDAYNKEFVDKLDNFDILIDDGPHTEESQIKFLELYCNKIKEGGVLIIEDILSENSKIKFEEIVKTKFSHLSYEFLDLRRPDCSKPDNMIFVVRNK